MLESKFKKGDLINVKQNPELVYMILDTAESNISGKDTIVYLLKNLKDSKVNNTIKLLDEMNEKYSKIE